jgi:hypothetical protein
MSAAIACNPSTLLCVRSSRARSESTSAIVAGLALHFVSIKMLPSRF